MPRLPFRGGRIKLKLCAALIVACWGTVQLGFRRSGNLMCYLNMISYLFDNAYL